MEEQTQHLRDAYCDLDSEVPGSPFRGCSSPRKCSPILLGLSATSKTVCVNHMFPKGMNDALSA